MSPPFYYTAAKFLVYCRHIRHRLGGVSDMTMEVPKRKLVFSSFVWQDIEPLFKITKFYPLVSRHLSRPENFSGIP